MFQFISKLFSNKQSHDYFARFIFKPTKKHDLTTDAGWEDNMADFRRQWLVYQAPKQYAQPLRRKTHEQIKHIYALWVLEGEEHALKAI